MPYSESNSRLMLIDDRDPAVQYDGAWDRQVAFGESMSISVKPNASVSMEFDGTRIMVVVLAVPVDANYTSEPKVQFAIDDVVVQTVVPDPMTNWTFYPMFDSQGLEDGTHTVNVTVLETSDDYPLLFDYFMFQPSQKYWSLAFAPSTLEVTSDDNGATSHKKPNVGAIVGGVLGGIALIALGVALFWWWRRKGQHSYMSLESNGSEPKLSSKTVTPFTSTRPTSMLSTDSKRLYSDSPDSSPLASSSSTSPASFPTTSYASTPSSAPSEYSIAGATAASGSESSSAELDGRPAVVVPSPSHEGFQTHETPSQHSVHGRVGVVDSAPVRKGRRPSMADLVQTAIHATRWAGFTNRREDSTPTEAPPRYSER
ncbi:hypothetical protein BC628DRAFT_1385631 [Trametes gibbosa]|nr:hypothetical protein BC628DRAFT_1385631 [Trametes gibbosa]